ncbi:HupE/UreJ family protein [Phycisphaera mikurensis]|uniref:HupE/UreJ family protein n=1 Tax=Phycisphaera mikurensis (strain NBRC 102666 / KCTC 22515 / FYK2301M01) TaxID=1142394 RepID=I0IF86_PHYMF|nr:HupE/UreJ family protein [Phycisphaera mikurensis]MBB6440680.1 hypothetical protein [Phycisphaera mikurensis]BAM03924.1 hypothetical protein PSMK_17650 [Phycisphaera mikurensis NBRC 102666]
MRRLHPLPLLFAALLAALGATPAAAHKPSDSYLRVLVGPAARAGDAVAAPSDTPVRLRWDVSLKDLDFLVGLDADGDSALTWGELKAKRSEIAAATLSRLGLEADGVPLTLRLDDLLVTDHSDGAYAVLAVGTDAEAEPATLAVRYRLLFDADPTHRGLVFVDAGEGPSAPAVLGPDADATRLDLAAGGGRSAASFLGFVREGVYHIWIGLDHVLFLITLMLPAVLLRSGGRWTPAPAFAPAAGGILALVTSFTVAHSVTLWLATTGWVEPPSRLVESVIAASIIVSAVHNLAPRLPLTGVGIAFAFGLLHGFGFASVLRDLGLGGTGLGVALLGFNVGVELGQLAIVAAFFPVAWLLRATAFYRVVALRVGSALVALLAAAWLAERALGLEIVGF